MILQNQFLEAFVVLLKWLPSKMEYIFIVNHDGGKFVIWCVNQYFQGPEIQWKYDLVKSTGNPRKSAQGGITGLGGQNEQK